MKKAEEAPLFVRIRQPTNMQRNILEATKGIIESLQKYERVKTIRNQKKSLIAKLKHDLREVSSLINKLKQDLPKVSMPAVKSKQKKETIKKDSLKQEKAVKKKEDFSTKTTETDLDKLEKELNEIEAKLDSLG